MDRGRSGGLIRIKASALRHPAAIAAGTTALVALLALNVTAFVGGLRAPWLLGGVIIADMLVIGAGVIVSDGEEFPIEASISQAGEASQRFYTVILRDITVRKRYEDELKRQQQELRELSARVLEAREEEKTLIARELHDELGQLLTALKMDLSWVRERVAADAEVAKKASEMNAMLDQTV